MPSRTYTTLALILMVFILFAVAIWITIFSRDWKAFVSAQLSKLPHRQDERSPPRVEAQAKVPVLTKPDKVHRRDSLLSLEPGNSAQTPR